MSRRHRRRAGRQRKLDAKRNQRAESPTVRAALKRPEVDRGTPELRAHRRHAAFNGENAMAFDGTASLTFPLSIMRSRGVIDVELHDAGMRFAALSWALFGEPFAGCESLYERMVGSTDRSPIGEVDTERAAERREARRRLHEGMLSELCQNGESTRMRRVIRDVCQFANTPRWLVADIEGLRYRPSDFAERALLIEGLGRLAAMERQRSPRRAA